MADKPAKVGWVDKLTRDGVIVVLIALLMYYITLPLDGIPDAVNFFGYLDDGMMFLLTLWFVNKLYKR